MAEPRHTVNKIVFPFTEVTMERGGTMYTDHRDAPGSVTEITNASGGLVERYEYDVIQGRDDF